MIGSTLEIKSIRTSPSISKLDKLKHNYCTWVRFAVVSNDKLTPSLLKAMSRDHNALVKYKAAFRLLELYKKKTIQLERKELTRLVGIMEKNNFDVLRKTKELVALRKRRTK